MISKNLVEAIHKTNIKFFANITGGGASFISDFLKYPGGSVNFIGANIPYNWIFFDKAIGGKPDKYYSQRAAEQLATAALKNLLDAGFGRINFNSEASVDIPLGIGVSASLTKGESEREGRENGAYICFIAYIRNANPYKEAFNVYFSKKILFKEKNREKQEQELANFILESILLFNEKNILKAINGDSEQLLANESLFFSDIIKSELSSHSTYFCGSFNPLHDGHKAIISYYEEKYGIKPILEITTCNTDKAIYSAIEFNNIISSFNQNNLNFIITDKSRFRDKVKINTHNGIYNVKFIVGMDTIVRIWRDLTQEEIEYYEKYNIKFIVFPRKGEEVSIPSRMKDIIIYERGFQSINISSSKIRAQKA